MDILTKAVSATITDTSTSADDFPGTFMVELSNESLDRDGDTLKADEWETPLPEQITFVNDHTHKMASVVGSAKPTLEDGKIICRGDWAETQNGQDTRKVIKHVPYTSVAYREKRDRKAGTVSRELINGSFVVVPSNPKAKVLASKSFDELDDDTMVSELTVKQLRDMLAGHGNVPGTEEVSQQTPEAPVTDTADQSADLLAGKAAAQALAAAFEITTRTTDLEG